MALLAGCPAPAWTHGTRASQRPATVPRAPLRRGCVERSLTGRKFTRAAAGPPGSGSDGSGGHRGGSNLPAAPGSFLRLESLLETALALRRLPGDRGEWQEVAGSWVLFPLGGAAPEAVVHFLGGAFVGAAPQLAYRPFLEALASRGVVVIATPFSTSFDHLRVADEVQYKFDRAAAALQAEVGRLPVYGVGHSLGAVLHTLIGARYTPERAGNALMAFNNRPATDGIPFLSPLLAPYARALGPLLSSVSAPGPLRSAAEAAGGALKGMSPALARQVAPLVEQLTPILLDVSQGRQEFTPPPEETKRMIRGGYAVRRNLLLRFRDDTIDETLGLAVLLQESSAISSSLDISVRTLPGDHVRPMQQAFVDLPPELARAANQAAAQGSNLLGRLAGLAQQAGIPTAAGTIEDLSKGVNSLADMLSGQTGSPVADSVQALADEVAAWMGVGGVVTQGSKALPASVVVERSGTQGAA